MRDHDPVARQPGARQLLDARERLGFGKTGVGGDHGPPVVASDTDRRIDGNSPEERHSQLGGGLLRATFGKDVGLMVAMGTDEPAHVLHEPQHRDVHLVEHRLRLDGVGQGHVLRRGHYHRAADADLLRDGELDVAGAGRQIEDQVVQVTPAHVAQQLHQGAVQHRAPPDHRLIGIDEEPDADHLHAERGERDDALAVFAGRTRAEQAHHQRQRRAVDVGVQQADLAAQIRQRDGDVGGDRALSHPALAGADQDDVLHRRDKIVGIVLFGGRRADVGSERDLHARKLQRREHGPHRFLDPRLVRRGRRRQLDAHPHASAVEHLGMLEVSKLGHRPAGRGVLEILQR